MLHIERLLPFFVDLLACLENLHHHKISAKILSVQFFRVRQGGKAVDSESIIRWFESSTRNTCIEAPSHRGVDGLLLCF